jgi:hypothetical protein
LLKLTSACAFVRGECKELLKKKCKDLGKWCIECQLNAESSWMNDNHHQFQPVARFGALMRIRF